MRVRWQQIDQRVAAKAGARLRSVAHATETVGIASESYPTVRSEESVGSGISETRAQAQTAPLQQRTLAQTEDTLEPIWSVFSFVAALFIVCLYAAVCFSMGGPLTVLVLTLLPAGCVATWAASPNGRRGNLSSPTLRGYLLTPDEQLRRALLPAATEQTGENSRAEYLYGEVIYLLASDTARGKDARRGRLLLKECNTLLAEHYRMETQKRRLRAVIEQESHPTHDEQEHTTLIARLAEETDPIARRSLRESLELCEERLTSVQSLRPLLSRMEAHQEVICQALALARTALVREQATPLSLAAPDVTALRQTVRGITSRTRAVEEAVAEMADL
jgi:hypothetical protein